MMIKMMISFAAAILMTTAVSGVSLAKGGTPQNHHCVKDGAVMEGTTRKDCKKAGGKWEKDAAAGKPGAAGGKAADGADKAPEGK